MRENRDHTALYATHLPHRTQSPDPTAPMQCMSQGQRTSTKTAKMISRLGYSIRSIPFLRTISSRPPASPEINKGEAPADSAWPQPKTMPMTPGTPNPSSLDPLSAKDRVEAFGREAAKSESYIEGVSA
jgi:hypothetical protein